MTVFATILLVSAVVVAVYLVMIYNNLIQVKHDVSKAWANIDVLLKQRHDEIPKLVEICKQYRQFEQEFTDQDVPRPPFWGGYRVLPTQLEFWYGRPDRLHDRVLYTKDRNDWRITRLYP